MVHSQDDRQPGQVPDLYLGDALELLSKVPSRSAGLILSDPPYNTTMLDYERPIDLQALWGELQRIRQPHAPVVLFTAHPFTFDVIASNRQAFGYEVIWAKSRTTGGFNSGWRPLQGHENILVFYAHGSTYNPQLGVGEAKGTIRRKAKSGHYFQGTQRPTTYRNAGERQPTTVVFFESAKRGEVPHPSVKPLELCRYLVRTYSRPGDLVADPFMGSGTTGVAALQEGRRFVGCEVHAPYLEVARARLGAVEQPLPF